MGIKPVDKYKVYFNNLEEKLNGEKGSFIHKKRVNAFASFLELGFPGRKHEEWKYFNPTHFSDLIPSDSTGSYDANTVKDQPIVSEVVHKIILNNGFLDVQNSEIQSDEEGLIIKSIKDASKTHKESIDSVYDDLANTNEEAFSALNTAFTKGGIFIGIRSGAVLKYPILIHNNYFPEENRELIFNRVLIHGGRSSEFSLLEISNNYNSSISANINSLVEVHLDEGSHLSHYMIQDSANDLNQIGTIEAGLKRDSHYFNSTITLGGSRIRNNVHARLLAENAYADLQGLYVVGDDHLVDNHILIDHIRPNCESNQLYKGLMKEKGTGVFNGKIFVKQEAQKTNAYQTNNNILLSEDATINTKPQLEIFADDVKCSHGATTGNLDPEALFYMKARGIPEDQARTMLTYGFASEVLANIKIESLRDHLESRLHEIL